MEDLVTVVIPTYGRTCTLRRAIESIITQTYNNLEIIVVNDNQNEGLKEEVNQIVESFKDDRLICINNETNMGGALSRNIGIMQSSSDYIAFLDDDDWYLPSKIELQLEKIKSNPQIAVVGCWASFYRNDRQVFVDKRSFKGNCVFESMYCCMAATSQWLCRKEMLLNVGMFSDVPSQQDSDLLLKLMLYGYEIDFVNDVLSVYDDSNRPRISNSSSLKKILGLELLHNNCCNNYYKISEKQRNLVEYSFAIQLYPHYKNTHNEKRYECLGIIIKHPFKSETIGLLKLLVKSRIINAVNTNISV